MKAIIVGSIAAILGGITGAHALTVDKTYGLLTTIQRMPTSSSQLTYENVMARITQPVRLYDLDHNGLDQADLDAVAEVQTARLRAQLLLRFLPFDLNNDKAVTREEVERSYQLGVQYERDPTEIRKSFAAADVNNDGVLTWDEMSAVSDAYGDQSVSRYTKSILAFDPTPDSAFTLDDAKVLTDQLFAAYDKDKNGVLDRTETSPAVIDPAFPR